MFTLLAVLPSCRSPRAHRWRWSIRPTATAAAAASSIAHSPAVTMAPHPNNKVGKQIAVVDADLCAACGSVSAPVRRRRPFRSAADLVTGIDLPSEPIARCAATLPAAAGHAEDRPADRRLRLCAWRGNWRRWPGMTSRRSASNAPACCRLVRRICAARWRRRGAGHRLPPGGASTAGRAMTTSGCGPGAAHLRAGVPRERLELAWPRRRGGASEAGAATAARRVAGLPPGNLRHRRCAMADPALAARAAPLSVRAWAARCLLYALFAR